MVKKYTLLPRTNPNSRDRVKCLKCDDIKEHHAKGMCYDCYRKYAWARKKIVCSNCKRERFHKAFGLCGGCHTRLHHYEKTLRYNAKKYHDIDYELSKEITRQCASCGFSKVVQLHHLDGNTKNNERENIVEAIERISKALGSRLKEIIIVDDNSPDETWKIVKKSMETRTSF